MRIIGIDYGDSRIGVALSDALGFTAQPVTVIAEKDRTRQLEAVKALVSEHGATEIVIGMPKNMNGSVGERAEKTRAFGNDLKQITGLPVIEWDERLTTAAAHRTLAEGLVSGKKRKGILDKLAAVFILQGYLDSK